MKSERRHQLQQNELAGQIDKARNWMEPYLVPLLLGIIAVTVIAIGISLYQNRSASQRSDATLDLLFSTTVQPEIGEDPEAFARVSETFGEGPPAMIAALAKADIYLASGINALFTDREEAKTKLEDAVVAYNEVLETARMPLLRSRAQYGLAQALESQGKIDEAIAAYEKVVGMNESEAMVTVAKERAAALERPVTQEFVAWFDKQTPTAFDPAAPPQVPSSGGLPEFPDFNLPGVTPPPPDGNAAAPSGNFPLNIGEILQQAGGGQAPLVDNPDVEMPAEPTATTPTDVAPAEDAETASDDSAPADEEVSEEPADEEPADAEPAESTPDPLPSVDDADAVDEVESPQP